MLQGLTRGAKIAFHPLESPVLHDTLQYGLFAPAASVAAPAIGGLAYLPRFVCADTEAMLLAACEHGAWRQDFKRRTQHYGYRYDYKGGGVHPAEPIPHWLQPLCERLAQEGHFATMPDQVLINEYLPGQGIAAHTDRPAFGGVVASLSLGSACVMTLERPPTARKEAFLLERCSLLVLGGEARYEWQHGIAPRKTDHIHGMRIGRGRRVSVTFRTVLPQP